MLFNELWTPESLSKGHNRHILGGMPSRPLGPREVSRQAQIIFRSEADFSGREETLYHEVNATGHLSFQGRVRLSSCPKEAPWAQYHHGSG